MTEKQEKYFIAAYEKRNIALAAAENYVSRPVISRAILDLEEEIGVQLFVRSKTGVFPTDAAKNLYRVLNENAIKLANTLEDIKHIDNDNNRVLKIGVTPTNSRKLTELYLNDFCKLHPELDLYVTEHPVGDELRLLANREVDIAFSPTSTKLPENYKKKELYSTRIVLALKKDHPLAQKSELGIYDILNLKFACLSYPIPLENILETAFSAFDKKLIIAVRSSMVDTLKMFAENNDLVPILPNDFVESWDGFVGIPLSFFLTSTHSMIWDSTRPQNTAFYEFRRYVDSKQESI